MNCAAIVGLFWITIMIWFLIPPRMKYGKNACYITGSRPHFYMRIWGRHKKYCYRRHAVPRHGISFLWANKCRMGWKQRMFFLSFFYYWLFNITTNWIIYYSVLKYWLDSQRKWRFMRTATEWTLKSMSSGSARKCHLQCCPISILTYYKTLCINSTIFLLKKLTRSSGFCA